MNGPQKGFLSHEPGSLESETVFHVRQKVRIYWCFQLIK